MKIQPLSLEEKILFYLLKGSNDAKFLSWAIFVCLIIIKNAIMSSLLLADISDPLDAFILALCVALACIGGGWIKIREEAFGIN